ncbi:1-phosphofructokinase family hexose kinase [Microbacterium sp. 1.5R]|uniref:1-phosphofructokinase family hexose kinase n=1 Tax=Microbacterium sp. 1.5R TaxID=1916917 RepID=UPI0011A928FC|nr:PfkB family carbohydrate kinase [Microbacterium sp. 1.5R]
MISMLALSPAVDVTYELDALAAGGINRPSRTTKVAGGKALNAARVARALGADVRATVALGGATGEWIRRRLEVDDVPATVIALAAETRTCLALVEADGGASSTDVYEHATDLSSEEWGLFAEAVGAAPVARWTAVSGSIPPGVPPAELAALLSALRAGGSRVAVDTSGAALAHLAAHSDLVKVNRAEASELLDREMPDAASACRGLHEQFGVDAVVTDGIRGGAALYAGELHPLAPPRAIGRFPAGSGDAFFGGLLAGLDGGAPFTAALAGARDAAERNAQVPGQGVLAPFSHFRIA